MQTWKGMRPRKGMEGPWKGRKGHGRARKGRDLEGHEAEEVVAVLPGDGHEEVDGALPLVQAHPPGGDHVEEEEEDCGEGAREQAEQPVVRVEALRAVAQDEDAALVVGQQPPEHARDDEEIVDGVVRVLEFHRVDHPEGGGRVHARRFELALRLEWRECARRDGDVGVLDFEDGREHLARVVVGAHYGEGDPR